MDGSTLPVTQQQVIQVNEGETLGFAGVAGLLKVDRPATGGRFVAALFPEIPPRVLAAPLHRHQKEDEYTCVLEGSLGVQLDDTVATVEAGSWVVKPRGQWHTFWNPADVPCRTLEIVSPAGFEQYFRDLAATDGGMTELARLNERYAIDMDMDSVPALCHQFGLRFPQR